MAVVLHYFECRSRGQALRFALVGSGVDFEDRRVPLEALTRWREKARDESLGGPFASLPVLDWDATRIAQTLAVASYLSEKLGIDERFGDPETRAYQQMIVSAAHLDMQAPYSNLLWLPEDVSDERLIDVARKLLGKLTLKLHQLEALRARQGDAGVFFGGLQPGMADYFVYESLDRACSVFGSIFEENLAVAPRLAKLREMLRSDPGQQAYAKAGGVPANVSGNSREFVIRERLSSLDLRATAR